jgi:hypothetical protein
VSATAIAIDPGLLERFRAAGRSIAWRPAPKWPRPAGRGAEIAHLHDEECRVERRGTGRTGAITVESGPLGALVLLLAFDARGPPRDWGAGNAGRDPAYPGGSLSATWGRGTVPHDTRPTVADLVELARYALA